MGMSYVVSVRGIESAGKVEGMFAQRADGEKPQFKWVFQALAHAARHRAQHGVCWRAWCCLCETIKK